MGASLDAGDRLDGGTGRDVVFLHGDYSAGLTFDDQTIRNIEALRLGKGFDYDLTLADGNVAAGGTLTINAAALGAGNHLTFDGSQERDGHFVVFGGAGGDTLSVDGNHRDYVTLGSGTVTNVGTLMLGGTYLRPIRVNGDITTLAIDTSGVTSTFGVDLSKATSSAYAISTGSSHGTIEFGGNFSATDTISGTGGTQLFLDGDYSAGLMLSGAKLGGVTLLHVFNPGTVGNSFATVELGGDYSAGVSINTAGGPHLEFASLKLDDGFDYKFTVAGSPSEQTGATFASTPPRSAHRTRSSMTA
jgi:hypothetical protein